MQFRPTADVHTLAAAATTYFSRKIRFARATTRKHFAHPARSNYYLTRVGDSSYDASQRQDAQPEEVAFSYSPVADGTQSGKFAACNGGAGRKSPRISSEFLTRVVLWPIFDWPHVFVCWPLAALNLILKRRHPRRHRLACCCPALAPTFRVQDKFGPQAAAAVRRCLLPGWNDTWHCALACGFQR